MSAPDYEAEDGGSDSRGRSGDVADHHALPRNGTARGCHRLPAAPRDAQRVTQAEPPQRGQGFDSPGGHSGFQIPTCGGYLMAALEYEAAA
jgi:hypothetical protein